MQKARTEMMRAPRSSLIDAKSAARRDPQRHRRGSRYQNGSQNHYLRKNLRRGLGLLDQVLAMRAMQPARTPQPVLPRRTFRTRPAKGPRRFRALRRRADFRRSFSRMDHRMAAGPSVQDISAIPAWRVRKSETAWSKAAGLSMRQ